MPTPLGSPHIQFGFIFIKPTNLGLRKLSFLSFLLFVWHSDPIRARYPTFQHVATVLGFEREARLELALQEVLVHLPSDRLWIRQYYNQFSHPRIKVFQLMITIVAQTQLLRDHMLSIITTERLPVFKIKYYRLFLWHTHHWFW